MRLSLTRNIATSFRQAAGSDNMRNGTADVHEFRKCFASQRR